MVATRPHPLFELDSTPARRTARILLVPLVVCLLALVFWDTVALAPLKVLVVFFHELSHGLAAVLTGGSIERIELSADEGGVCYTRGGWPFVIFSAGYLGSLAAGATLFVTASRTRLDKALTVTLGTALAIVTLVYVRSAFGFAYGLGAGAALVLVGWRLPEVVSDVVLRTIGVVSCLYVPWDILTDLVLRSHPDSDASQLAAITLVPGILWGLAWTAIALAIVVFTVKRSIAQPKSRQSTRGRDQAAEE